jgi:bifunctional non-homologous end joining protein LigD
LGYAFVSVAFAHHLHRTLPAQFRQNTADGARLDSRDQARRLSGHRPARRQKGATDQSKGQRPHQPLSPRRASGRGVAGAVCIIDGEAIISDATGLAVFSLVRSYRNGPRATLCAFDLIEIDGEDLRWQPIEDRKAALKKLLRPPHPGIAFNKHFDVEGTVVFHHACKLGCEGIVSKRLGSPYRFGRSNDWIKIKNPAAPAVKREAEEEWR